VTLPIAGMHRAEDPRVNLVSAPPAPLLWSRDGVLARGAMIFLPLAIAAIAVFYMLYTTHLAASQGLMAAGQRQLVEVGVTTLNATLATLDNDAQFVASEPMLKRWLSTGDAEDRAILLEQFQSFVQHRGLYDQVRFIDARGMEALRVNWNDGSAMIVPDTQLQDKSGRYYVDRSLGVPEAVSYFSPFDLNVENGLIEQPLKPTIRIGRPVFDALGTKRGIVVLNYLGSRAIDRVRRLATQGLGQAWLVDANGYWLLGPDPAEEWGFMYPQGSDRSFAATYPAAWEQIAAGAQNEQMTVAGDLFSFAPVYLPEGTMTGGDALSEAKNAPSFFLVTRTPSAQYSEVSLDLARAYLLPLVAILLVLGLIAWIIANHGARRRAAERLAVDLNARLLRDNATLEVVNRELESFSYSVSHDLRAPLRSIDGFSNALLEDYAEALDETGRDYLLRVRNAAQRMGDLIDDLLKLARVSRTELSDDDVDLSLLVQHVIAELRQQDPQRQVMVQIEPHLTARADYRLVQIMLQNLLGNAWKFSGKTEHAAIAFGATQEGGETVYFVRDNGAGFDMAHAGKLFGVFQRLHAMTEFAGTGIGLATVQRIVYKHGGRVWARAEKNRGATFLFTLGSGGRRE